MSVTSFTNKVAAITGAGSGMGRALALQLAAAGCNVAICDVDAAGLEETRSQLPANVMVTHSLVDVSDRTAVENFARETREQHGKINMIFNNAGVSVTGLAEQMPYEDIEWVMNVNFWGVVYGCKAFLPYLHEVDEAAIVNTSSIFGTIALPSQSVYNASKFAVRGYSYSLRRELASTHIGVSCVQPGGVNTNIVKSSRFIPVDNASKTKDELVERFHKLARKPPEDAAAIILKGVLKNKAQILVGGDARVISWLERLVPTAYLKLMPKIVQ